MILCGSIEGNPGNGSPLPAVHLSMEIGNAACLSGNGSPLSVIVFCAYNPGNGYPLPVASGIMVLLVL